MQRLLFWFFVVVFFSCFQAAIPDTERQSLVDLYLSTTGDSWQNTLSGDSPWHINDLTSDPCEAGWFGVFCNPAKTGVIGVNIFNNLLAGSLVALDLPFLTSLSLPDNQIRGSIPNFSKIRALTSLDLSNNQITGSIPDFSGTPALTSLSLDINQITGSIPDFFALPASLLFLDVSNNELCGQLPTANPAQFVTRISGSTFLFPSPGWCGACATFDVTLGECCEEGMVRVDGSCIHPYCSGTVSTESDPCTPCPVGEQKFGNECVAVFSQPPASILWSVYSPACIEWDASLFSPSETGSFTLQTGNLFDSEILFASDVSLDSGSFNWAAIYGILPSPSARVKAVFGTREPIYSELFEVTRSIGGHKNPCSIVSI